MTRLKAEVLTIGNEVLKGSVLNTNAQFLGRELTSLGFEVAWQGSCRDLIPEIAASLETAFDRADLVILTGGLGPTPDDLTREAVAEFFQTPLKFSAKQFRFIQNYYRGKKRKIPGIVRKEAYFPSNSVPLFNRVGIALGFYILKNGKMAVVLPGVPFELKKMFLDLVIPVIKKCFPRLGKLYRLTVKTVGLSEPAVMRKLGKNFFEDSFDFGIYPEPGEATLRLYADSSKIILRLKSKVKNRLSASVYAWEETSLSAEIGKILRFKRKKIAAAESCTGGLLAAQLTQTPGASSYFQGGVVVYQRKIKQNFGISSSVLKKYGTISRQTAVELAQKVRLSMIADYGIGITGVAGPDQEEGQPVGRVYLAIADQKTVRVWEENFLGERLQVQTKAVKKALHRLWEILR